MEINTYAHKVCVESFVFVFVQKQEHVFYIFFPEVGLHANDVSQTDTSPFSCQSVGTGVLKPFFLFFFL